MERVSLQDREVWRYGGDARLMAALLGDDAIKQRLASPAYRQGRDARRIRLLADAVMVEPELLPNLAVAVERLRSECAEATQIECFVFSHPEINAFVCQGRNRTIVGLSSAAVNHLDADELMFVLGHEFGHAIFGHLDLCAGQLVEDPAVMPGATMRVRSWQRSAEISADRAGVVMAGSLAAATRAIFKVASGIVSANVTATPEKFAAQWQRLVDEVIDDGEREFQNCSHPFPPLRMRAVCDFWAACAAADRVPAIKAVDRSVDRMLATMDPAGSSGPLADPLLGESIFWGGLYVALASGDVSAPERERLASVMPVPEEIDAAIMQARSSPEWCRQRFLEGIKTRRKKYSAIELHRVIFGLLDLASADCDIHADEVARLRELGESIGVSAHACDIVVNQYQSERRHERAADQS